MSTENIKLITRFAEELWALILRRSLNVFGDIHNKLNFSVKCSVEVAGKFGATG